MRLCFRLFALTAFFLPIAAAAANTPLRLYVLDCGTLAVADLAAIDPVAGKGKSKTLADACYLVVHPKGTLVWDTGLGDELAAKPEGVQAAPGFHMSMKKSVAAQFKEIGVAPDSVRYLGLSHMHGDHIGNVSLFPHSTLLMQKEEYAAAFGPRAASFGNDPSAYPTLARNPVTKLNGDHDVFGDGSVLIKRAPGHTPGHQVLFLQLPNTGKVLLSGDMTVYESHWHSRTVPTFNFDKPASRRTMAHMARFLKANQAKLWIQHDFEQNATLRRAPAYYD
ncbi:N-acyl homoserine lactonase family protein [Massilia violaceinigra]|nr:N-acyl homoserine lactonase family protein [Massilia violaceinigra]